MEKRKVILTANAKQNVFGKRRGCVFRHHEHLDKEQKININQAPLLRGWMLDGKFMWPCFYISFRFRFKLYASPLYQKFILKPNTQYIWSKVDGQNVGRQNLHAFYLKINLLENETGWVKRHRLCWKSVFVERLHCNSIERHRKKTRRYWFPVPIFWTAWIPWDFHVAFVTVWIAHTQTYTDLNFAIIIPVRDMLKLDADEIEEGGSIK